jgi:predicted dithiol-disulfide oxidoreductase (DUF899 family)
MATTLANHPVVSRQQWLAERRKLLAREKELTRLGDEVARERRALPWVRLEQSYLFETREGRRPLADLFDGRRQLLMQHFMLGPGWNEGCFMHYNFVRIHQTLRCTPAMAAGVTKTSWELEDMVKVLEDWEAQTRS